MTKGLPVTSAIFHCRFCADNLLFVSQQIRCGSTGTKPAIGTENIAQPLCKILKKQKNRKTLRWNYSNEFMRIIMN